MQAQIRRRRILSGSTAALLSAETFAAGFCPAAATAVGGTAVSGGFVSVCSDIDCAHYLWNGIAKGMPTPVQTFICNAPNGVKPIWLGRAITHLTSVGTAASTPAARRTDRKSVV